MSNTMDIDFEALEDIIISISAGKGQCPVFLQSHIQKYLQSGKQMSK